MRGYCGICLLSVGAFIITILAGAAALSRAVADMPDAKSLERDAIAMHRAAALITGRAVNKPPADVVMLADSDFARVFCNAPAAACSVKAVYLGNLGARGLILVRSTYGHVNGAYDRDYALSVLLHEQVHHLQDRDKLGKHPSPSACIESETEAYGAQRVFLEELGRDPDELSISHRETIFFQCTPL